MPELVAEDIAKRLGENEILRGVSLRLERGEILALLGPSGSGKTTLLRSVAGLERPDRGRIAIGGKPIFDADADLEIPAERRGLGLVFQSYAIWPHRTVFENVAYGLKLRRMPNREIKTKVDGMLERLGLKDLAARYPHQLSGGQQQRV
ncbi:MAG TPA: ABC transporter ATP-binding protein, partial [Candidatus Binatia bacterium]